MLTRDLLLRLHRTCRYHYYGEEIMQGKSAFYYYYLKEYVLGNSDVLYSCNTTGKKMQHEPSGCFRVCRNTLGGNDSSPMASLVPTAVTSELSHQHTPGEQVLYTIHWLTYRVKGSLSDVTDLVSYNLPCFLRFGGAGGELAGAFLPNYLVCSQLPSFPGHRKASEFLSATPVYIPWNLSFERRNTVIMDIRTEDVAPTWPPDSKVGVTLRN